MGDMAIKMEQEGREKRGKAARPRSQIKGVSSLTRQRPAAREQCISHRHLIWVATLALQSDGLNG